MDSGKRNDDSLYDEISRNVRNKAEEEAKGIIDLDDKIKENDTNSKNKKHKKKSKVRLFFKILGIIILIICLLGCIAAGVIYTKAKPLIDNAKEMAYEKMSNIDKNTFMKLSDTEIYDKDGNKIGEINISNYQYADIKEISKYIQDGYIAVEDNNFATHNGIDYKALLRAGVALVKNKGAITQGGSTITQQVLKNNVIGLDMDKWDRKILELFLAPEFEKMFSKAEIMEFYCNSNFYANNCYGVETASLYYFGKSAKDLTLGEAAILVGLSNNPAKYNPVKHPEAAKEKRTFVLTRMLEEEKITQTQFDQANKEELTLVLDRDKRGKESYQVSYAIHCTALKLMENEGFEFKYTFLNKDEYDNYKAAYSDLYSEMASKVRGGGYKVYTTLDTEKQAKLQEVVDDVLKRYKEKAEDGRYAMQGAATLVDNNTGYVVAIVGGRGTEDEYNRGYQAYRQPGSSIKPIVAYAPAFETGKFYPSLKIKDEKVEGGPRNANGRFIGNISIREAIGRSTNTIAYKVLQSIGPSTGVEYLGKLKFSGLSYQDTYNGSMALGGFTYGTTTAEMAKAYSTLVTAGTYGDNTCIKKIEFQDGTTPYNGEIKYTQVYTPDTSYMVLDCIKGVITEPYGTGRAMAVPGQIIGGKTGTTNAKKDGWFCGVSDYYSLAVWCGYDQPRAIPEMAGGKYPGEIFQRMMVYLHQGLPEVDFEKPETVFEDYVDWKGERVDYKSGEKDLFSQMAIDRLEEQQRIAEEKARQEAEEKARKAEEEKVTQLRLDIEAFGKYSISSINDIYSFDKEYKALKKTANSIKDNGIKQESISKIEEYYSTINSLDLVKEYRTTIKENERKAAEEEARRKQEAAEKAAQLKLERLQAAETAIQNLEGWQSQIENANALINDAELAIKQCEEYSEYKGLSDRVDAISQQINDYFNPPVPVEEPVQDSIDENIGVDIDGDGFVFPEENAA